MRTALWIGLGIVVVIALVVVGLGAGWALWGRRLWTTAPPYAPNAGTAPASLENCDWEYGMGRGMVRRWPAQGTSCIGQEPGVDVSGELTIEQAHEAVEQYLAYQGYGDLEVAEVMEFERNFYAIVLEPDTGVGAMEVLVDQKTGAVGPEIGPNMMWNARYGMHAEGGMMGDTGGPNAISVEEATRIAQRWLDTNRPGVAVEEHVDPFYGYYTIHTLRGGEIEGMLSVHGTTGQVWYHTWHGAFVQMIEGGDDHEAR